MFSSTPSGNLFYKVLLSTSVFVCDLLRTFVFTEVFASVFFQCYFMQLECLVLPCYVSYKTLNIPFVRVYLNKQFENIVLQHSKLT